jgi:hypothetical protein
MVVSERSVGEGWARVVQVVTEDGGWNVVGESGGQESSVVRVKEGVLERVGRG